MFNVQCSTNLGTYRARRALFPQHPARLRLAKTPFTTGRRSRHAAPHPASPTDVLAVGGKHYLPTSWASVEMPFFRPFKPLWARSDFPRSKVGLSSEQTRTFLGAKSNSLYPRALITVCEPQYCKTFSVFYNLGIRTLGQKDKRTKCFFIMASKARQKYFI